MMQPKRRRLVADTADDLQQILFGELEADAVPENYQPTSGEYEAVVPAHREELEDAEVFSDSDRDSMDEFIVRDTNDDREHRMIQNYSDRYGDDVAESLNDVIAVFGDLRILDIYAQGESGRLKRVVDPKKPIESHFEPEEVAAQLSSSRDEVILRTDVPERTQEEVGTERSLETITVFEEGISSDVLEAEWAIEAHWIYWSLRETYAQRLVGKSDWTMWTPVKPEDAEVKKHEMKQDHSAVTEDQYKNDVVKRIHVLLRDLKGRAMDPLLIWNSMARSKYWWYLNLEDMQMVRSLDLDWSKVWAKQKHIADRLKLFSEQTAAFLSTEEDSSEGAVPLQPIEVALATNLQGDLSKLQVELCSLVSPEGMHADLNESLDDITATISGEIEPVTKYLFFAAAAGSGRKKQKGSSSSMISSIISNSLHECLIPLLTLSPQELGENLSIGAKIHKGPFSGTAAPDPGTELPWLQTSLVDYLSATLAGNLKVRKWFRREFRSKAVIFTHPTSAGSVSVNKRFYAVRRLAGRPAESFFGTEAFLAISHLLSSGEITMELATIHENRLVVEGCEEVPEVIANALHQGEESPEDIDESLIKNAELLKQRLAVDGSAEFFTSDPLFADILYYMTPDVKDSTSWVGELRILLAKAVVSKLYRSMKAELLSKLTKDSFAVCSRNAASAFGELIRMRPFAVHAMVSRHSSSDDRVAREIVRRKLGFFTCVGVVAERLLNGFRLHLAVVNHRGDVVETLALDSLLGGMEAKREGERARIAAVLKRHLVALVVVGADDRKARIVFNELKTIAGNVYNDGDEVWNSLKGPSVQFGDLLVPGRVGKTINEDGFENESVNRAVSLARFQQSPIAETLTLWTDTNAESNQALTIPVHELQAFVPKPILQREFCSIISTVVANTGVDLNDCVSSRSRRSVLKFVPGLGARKARALVESADAHLRGIDPVSSSAQEGSSRVSRLSKIIGARVFANAQPFIRLAPDCDKVAVAMRDEDDSGSDSGDDDGDSSKSDEESADDHVSYDSKWFGVPNKIVRDVTKGYDWRELCRFGKDCWSISAALLAQGEGKSFFGLLGDSEGFRELLKAVDLDAFVDGIFKSEDVPAHLGDPEIDSGSLKMSARTVIEELVAKQLEQPFGDSITYEWTGISKQRLFYACMKESEFELNKWTVVTCTVAEVGSKDWIKLTESNTNMEGWIQKSRSQYNTRFNVGDTVRCRISEVDYSKFSMSFTFDPLSDRDMQALTKWHSFLVSLDSDSEYLSNLGKVEASAKPVVKARRIIKHESYFEIPHRAAVERLAQAPIGDVVFRPSASQPGQYFGMIKFMGTAESRDASKEDWIKVFRFTEGPSSRQASKTVFKLIDHQSEEFEEFDQMKVLFVDKYLRNLAELRSNPKFRPEHIDQVKNMIIAKIKTGTSHGSVVYSLVMDPRRECAGNALLLWASEPQKIHEDVIEITNRGFKWWTKGPYPSLNALLNWWKQGGYKERHALIEDWRNQLAKRATPPAP